MSAVASRPATNGRPAATATVPPVALEHEELVVRRGRRSGCHMAVAVHSTVLGPALGGARLWHYDDPADGVRDALRLARGMTYKAAVAGLDLGGGKGVICAPSKPPTPEQRRKMLLDFGDLVDSLDGRYITAEDVGITPGDLEVVAERTSHVTGLGAERGGSGDPSPFTAEGIEAAMRACARQRLGTAELAGLTVAIAGLGHVGSRLAERLADAGVNLIVADIDESRRVVADELGAQWVKTEEILSAPCDILAPCALGGAIDSGLLDALKAKVICGSANNQLADDSLADELDEHGVLYAPDYVVNSGGLIHVDVEIARYSEGEALELVRGIEDTLTSVFEIASREGITPLAAASHLASERLSAAAGVPRLVS